MKRIANLAAILIALTLALGAPRVFGAPAAQNPNVLFIAIDDLNDWVGCLGGHHQARALPASQWRKTSPASCRSDGFPLRFASCACIWMLAA